MHRTIRTLLAAAALAVLASCSPSDDAGGRPAGTTPSPTVSAAVDDVALVARTHGPVDVHAAPDAAVERTLPATTDFGFPTVLLVESVGSGDDDGWLEVLLPVRPVGSSGWVRAAHVELREVDVEVRVDLSTRELSLLESGTVVLTTPTAIGAAEHPTPTGRYYVTDKLEVADPRGAYGPYAIGLSARSEVLTEFLGGDGQVGIHGTDDPDSIGRAVSHGCLRIDDDVITELAHLLPLGTPVTIS